VEIGVRIPDPQQKMTWNENSGSLILKSRSLAPVSCRQSLPHHPKVGK
jgi:hypothetical protein